MGNVEEIVNLTVAKRIQQYVEIRDRVKAMDEAHEKAKKPFTDELNNLNGYLQEFLDKSGGDSFKTAFGTCYKSTRFTASLADSQAFMDYVVKNGRFELLDRKANSTAVKAFVEENGNLPPGCNLSQLSTVGVRRGKGDKDDE